MQYKYLLHEQDFLDFQLYTASKSESIRRKKRNGWIGLTITPLALAFLFWEDGVFGIYFLVAAILTLLFYPMYFMRRYKRHYENHIKQSHKNRFGESVIMEVHPDHIFTKDSTGEGKIYISAIDQIDETSKHFFVKISSGMTLIFPKENINSEQLKEEFKALKIPIHEELDWKWNVA